MLFQLLKALGANLFGQMTPVPVSVPEPQFRGPTHAKRRRSANAEIRESLGLRPGQSGNKLAVKAAKRRFALHTIK